MQFDGIISRRKILSIGSAGIASLTVPSALAQVTKSGGKNILFLVGDYWHNPITQEKNWQEVLRHTGWNLLFAQSTAAVTPEILAKTDLFVAARYWKANNLGWSADELVQTRDDEEIFLTEQRENAIVENVRRGMGFLAMHCSVWNGEHKKFMDMLGVAEPHMHTKVQPTFLHKLNPDHPISRGVEPSKLGEDEIFSADLIPGRSTVLFNLKGEEQPIDKAGGWCHDYGKGRVAAMLPGHTPHPFHQKSFKELMWRSAHWAMRLDLQPHEFVNGRPPERSIY